ncbi:MAG: fatty acid desaturase [Pseudomonadales bacterium]
MSLWREPAGAWPNSLALAYAFLGHAAGLALLLQGSWLALAAGVLLTAHSMIIAAYLVHECAHSTLFAARRVNSAVGEALLWVTGAAYASFDRVQHMHLRHHQDRADVALFDYRSFLRRMPPWAARTVEALEWAHVPAVELLMHAQVMLRPFLDDGQRRYRDRVVRVLLTRIALFALLASISPWALVGFALAYLLFLKGLFLGDAFAHTYPEFFVTDPNQPVPRDGRDRAYDTGHTFSNLLSPRHSRLNLWNLNFGYHTAHHERASIPWYRLPAAHAERYGADHPQVLPFAELTHTIHRHRVRRVLGEDYGAVGEGADRAKGFAGVLGVSFLSIV